MINSCTFSLIFKLDIINFIYIRSVNGFAVLFICWFYIIKSGRRDAYFYSILCTFLHFLMYKNNNAIILQYIIHRRLNLTHAFTYKFKSEMPFLSKIEIFFKKNHCIASEGLLSKKSYNVSVVMICFFLRQNKELVRWNCSLNCTVWPTNRCLLIIGQQVFAYCKFWFLARFSTLGVKGHAH